MAMLVNGVEVTRSNLLDLGLSTLRVTQGWGDVTEEKLLMKLISVEIKRQVKIENINTAAKKKSEWIVNNWDLIDRQAEPLHPLQSDRY